MPDAQARLPIASRLLQQLQETPLASNQLALWFLGQSGFIVQGGGATLIFDPYLSDAIQDDAVGPRMFPPPVDPRSLSTITLALATHDHADHLDPETLDPLLEASPQARVVTPAPGRQMLVDLGVDESRIIVPPVDEWIDLDGLELRAIPSAHYTLEEDEHGRPRFLGYIVRLAGVTLYHSGDTILYDGMIERLREQPIDLALLPINGRDWPREQANLIGNLTARETLYLAGEIGAGLLIPCHYDLFAGNGVNPAHFVDDLVDRYPDQHFKIMTVGERIIVTAG